MRGEVRESKAGRFEKVKSFAKNYPPGLFIFLPNIKVKSDWFNKIIYGVFHICDIYLHVFKPLIYTFLIGARFMSKGDDGITQMILALLHRFPYGIFESMSRICIIIIFWILQLILITIGPVNDGSCSPQWSADRIQGLFFSLPQSDAKQNESFILMCSDVSDFIWKSNITSYTHVKCNYFQITFCLNHL